MKKENLILPKQIDLNVNINDFKNEEGKNCDWNFQLNNTQIYWVWIENNPFKKPQQIKIENVNDFYELVQQVCKVTLDRFQYSDLILKNKIGYSIDSFYFERVSTREDYIFDFSIGY